MKALHWEEDSPCLQCIELPVKLSCYIFKIIRINKMLYPKVFPHSPHRITMRLLECLETLF